MRNRQSPLLVRTMVTLLQRPPLAMFDPSSIHRNDEIFNPEPKRLGIFLSGAAYTHCALRSNAAFSVQIVWKAGLTRPSAAQRVQYARAARAALFHAGISAGNGRDGS